MEVKKIPLNGCLQIFLAVFTLGVAPLLIWMGERNWPQRVDDQGLVTRGGKRIAWNEFTRITKVITRTSGGSVEHYELRSKQGKVIVPAYRLQGGAQVVDHIINRVPESALGPAK